MFWKVLGLHMWLITLHELVTSYSLTSEAGPHHLQTLFLLLAAGLVRWWENIITTGKVQLFLSRPVSDVHKLVFVTPLLLTRGGLLHHTLELGLVHTPVVPPPMYIHRLLQMLATEDEVGLATVDQCINILYMSCNSHCKPHQHKLATSSSLKKVTACPCLSACPVQPGSHDNSYQDNQFKSSVVVYTQLPTHEWYLFCGCTWWQRVGSHRCWPCWLSIPWPIRSRP